MREDFGFRILVPFARILAIPQRRGGITEIGSTRGVFSRVNRGGFFLLDHQLLQTFSWEGIFLAQVFPRDSLKVANLFASSPVALCRS